MDPNGQYNPNNTPPQPPVEVGGVPQNNGQAQQPQQPAVPQPIVPSWQNQASDSQDRYVTPSGADGHAPEYSIDYLNQIAPQEQRVVNRFAVFGLIGGGIVAALVALVMIASSGGPDVNQQLIPISQRITTLQTVTSAEQVHLAEAKISQANAALSSALGTSNTDILAIMKDRKLKVKGNSSEAKSEKAYSAKLKKILDDAYQRGTLDRIYTSQMTYELSLLKSKVTKLKKSTNSKSLDAFSDTLLGNIDLILNAYDSFDATKS